LISESSTGGVGCARLVRATAVSRAGASTVSLAEVAVAVTSPSGLTVCCSLADKSRTPVQASAHAAATASVSCLEFILLCGWTDSRNLTGLGTQIWIYLAQMRYTFPLLTVLVAGCALPPPPPPVAEFLVSAGDQTYWVQSNSSGVHVRGSPLILAHTDGRYYEVFVGEVDRSFPRALLTGERVYKRELASGDSTMIFEDTAIVRLAIEYHRAHPTVAPLGPDDDPDDDLDVTGVGETDILSVLGPYVALEHRLDVERADDRDITDTSRALIDLRTAKPVALDHMLRDTLIQAAAGEGGLLARRWKHDKYEVVSRYDSTRKSNMLLLRDLAGREWKLGLVSTSFVQIFWLDKPKVDALTRHALARAFNDATTYGERLQQASRRKYRAPRNTAGARRVS
jgi:hypothetical protein